MGKYENSICEAINILVDQAVSGLRLDKTVLATIDTCLDEGLRRYRVKYQDSVFTAYAQTNDKYRSGTKVYVLIPSNDVTADRIILGSISTLGTAYTEAITKEDRLVKIGSNLITNTDLTVGLCSYNGYDMIDYDSTMLGIKDSDIEMYSADADDIMIAATFKTSLPEEQIKGNGDYGIIVSCKYYNDETKEEVLRYYVLNVNKMLGQPYRFVIPSRQYSAFPTDGADFVGIEGLTVYCRNFPYTREGEPVDIEVSNFEFYFLRELSTEEISGASMKIVTPLGAYFAEGDNTKRLQADIRIKGGLISEDELDDVEFYWFVRDISINAESEHYFPYAGVGWKCLNPRLADSAAIGDDGSTELTEFQPTAAQLDISPLDCPSFDNIFKCVAMLEDTTLTAEITIRNKQLEKQVVLTGSEESNFEFRVTNSIDVICSIVNQEGEDVPGTYTYYWGYEADGQELIQLVDNIEESILTINPNIAANWITFYCTVYDNLSQMIGTASLSFSNGAAAQPLYNLVLSNANRIYKYNEKGVSPTSNSVEPQNRISILPVSFEVYDKTGKIVAETPEDKISSFEMRWLWPVENSMIETSYPVEWLDKVYYQDIYCYSMPITNTGLLEFVYGIRNSFNNNYINNTIFLEVVYHRLTLVAATNLLFTKDGEIGTNGTEYIARIVPVNDSNAQIQQVFVLNNEWKCWLYDQDDNIRIENFNPRFKIQLWDGGIESLMDSQTKTSGIDSISWKMLPNNKSISVDNSYSYIGRCIYNRFLEQANILQGQLNTRQASNLASNYFATYSIPTINSENGDCFYIVQGGFNHAVYNADGTREGYIQNGEPFQLRKFDINTFEEIEMDDEEILWTTSWDNKDYYGAEPLDEDGDTIVSPKYLNGTTDNFIRIEAEADIIIWPIHFYLNRYSMAALNNWDGNGIEIEDDKILVPQLAAGAKNSDNSFTGVAIGQTFSETESREVGLFGYNSGTRTIFLDAKTGKAVFGIPGNGSGCLEITPSSSKSQVSMQLYGSNEPSWSNNTLSGGSGAGLILSQTDSKLFFGNSFLLKQDNSGTNLYMSGAINATSGKVGNWVINGSALKGSDSGGTSTIILNSTTPSITLEGSNSKISGTDWYIQGNGNFSFGPSGSKLYKSGSKVYFSGDLNAAGGTFSGNLSAAGGTFTGKLSAATGSFTGEITAETGKIGGWDISSSQITSPTNSDGKLLVLNPQYLNGSWYGNEGTGSWYIYPDSTFEFSLQYYGTNGFTSRFWRTTGEMGLLAGTNSSASSIIFSSTGLTIAGRNMYDSDQGANVTPKISFINGQVQIGASCRISKNGYRLAIGDIDATGSINSDSNINCGGSMSVESTLTVKNNLTAKKNVSVTGWLDVGSWLDVNGVFTAYDGITAYGTITASSTSMAYFPRALSYHGGTLKDMKIDENGALATSSSSRRFKHDISSKLDLSIHNPFKLYNIPVVQFRYNQDQIGDAKYDQERLHLGFIAEDIAELIPEGATYDKDGIPDGWNKEVILVCAVKCLQEQKKEIDMLKEQISQLKEKSKTWI